ncbi:MAG: SDR family NAD(P)-dependent oxidoreductase [Chloroflexi bacterium]|nr:SDR family NAD(P)-dependent oxidoreductase [Chloroflexota bacterium]
MNVSTRVSIKTPIKVFITGATGFVGAHVARRLLTGGLDGQPADVVCLARDPARLDPDLRDRVRVLHGALDDLPRYAEMLAECDYVFHLAANAALAGPPDYHQANVEGTRVLVGLLARSPRLRRLVFTSTIGAVDRRPDDPCAEPLTEETPPHPLTEYGRSKLAAEQIVRQSGLPFAIVRPTWVYGPGMRANSHIRTFIATVGQMRLATRFAFPGRVSVVHVRDLVDALLLVALDPRAAGETYFASDGKPVALGAIFRDLGYLLGKPAGSIPLPAPVVRAGQALRPRLPLAVQGIFSDVLCAGSRKLEAIGFAAGVPFDLGLAETVRWHVRQAGQQPPAGTTLLTGAASGIGYELARQLSARNHSLLLVDRDEARLRALGEALDARWLTADLARPADLDRIRSFVTEERLTLGWVVNNAGIGLRGRVDELSFLQQRTIVDVNVVAPLYLSKLALEHFRRAGEGVLVTVASSAAWQPLPFMATYAASKAFVLHFSEALWAEQRDNPRIRVVTVCPAGTATSFQATAGVRNDDAARLLSPAAVAARIIQSAESGGTVTIGASARAMGLLARLLPRHLSASLWHNLMARSR